MALLGRLHGLRSLSSRLVRSSASESLFSFPLCAREGRVSCRQAAITTHTSRMAARTLLSGGHGARIFIQCSCVHTQQGSGSLLAASERSKPAAGGGKGSKQDSEHGSVLMQFVEKKQEPKQLTVGAKVVQAGKDMTYILVIIGGFALTGFLFWTVGSEFFSSSSTSSIYTKALKRIKANPSVCEVLGEPIMGHGEESGRGRRRHILHQEYIVEGKQYLRMKFYAKGSKRKGTVHLDLVKNDQGKYECRFLFVELQGYPPGTIVIEDNR